MKKIISFIFAATLLVGCQGETQKEEEKQSTAKSAEVSNKEAPKAKEAESSPEAAHSHDGHDHSSHEHGTGMAPGQKFQEIEPMADCEAPVVIEFFAYHCPHCYNLEPAAEKWREKNAGKVKFLSIPTTLGHDQLGSMVLVHHAAKKLGVLEKTQHALFERFHKEKKLFGSAEEAAEFLVAQGADKAQALEALNDKEYMDKSIGADYDLLMKYKVSSVPQVLVNHKYITNITAAGGHDEVFQLVDELLEKESSCGEKK